MKIILFVLMFLVIGALLILSNNNLPLYKDENISQFKILYTQWLDGVYQNTWSITGNAVNMKWMP